MASECRGPGYGTEHMFDYCLQDEGWPSDATPPTRGGREEHVVVRCLSWAGVRFDAVVEPLIHEVRRREASGLGAVTDMTTLDALSTLPIGMEVAWQGLDPVVAAYLGGLADGIVARSRTGVTRVLEPPLELVCLVQRAAHWRAIGRIGLFAGCAPTALIVNRVPREVEQAIDCANRAGVGLYVASHGSLTRLVTPTSRIQLTTRRTRLVEVIYRKWRRQNT